MFFSTQRIFKERGILSKYLSSAEKKIIRHKELNMHRVEIGLSFDYFFFTLGSQNYVRRLNLLGIGRLYRTATEGKKSN